uniref:Lipoprotein n=1 Tax=Chlorobium chlorochromatii (strain CaD3) TaxID=340177 RepID=Q3ASD7_CHLCH
MVSTALRHHSQFRSTLLLFAALLMLVSSCTPQQSEKDERQQHVESMMEILAQVQKNLARIQQKEAVVERLSTGVERSQGENVEQMGRDIAASIRYIDSTLAASRNLVQKLEEQNRTSTYRVESLDRLVAELQVAINVRDREVKALKGQVKKLGGQVASLVATVDVLDEYIDTQESEYYTAYYIAGSAEDLMKKGVLVPINPLQKIFGTNYRLASDFNINLFRKIDMMESRDFFFEKPLQSLTIITPHTRGSYELAGGKTSSLLVIRNEREFWQKSRCLVIVTE